MSYERIVTVMIVPSAEIVYYHKISHSIVNGTTASKSAHVDALESDCGCVYCVCIVLVVESGWSSPFSTDEHQHQYMNNLLVW
jgi:hypothetical protein